MKNNKFKFYIDNEIYTIKLTKHARIRMKQRSISEEDIIDKVDLLKLNEFRYLRRNSLEAIIIDNKNKISVVLGFNRNSYNVTVITVINKENPYISEGTVRVSL